MGKEWFRPKSARKAGGGSKHVMGCMTGFFHWFDLHRALFTTRCSSSSSGRYDDDDDDAIPMSSSSSNAAVFSTESGVKPPRNSLELDLDHLTATSTTATISSSLAFISEDYDIPFCIQVRKAKSGGNIVAKLMGLEEYFPNDTNIINNYNLAQPCSSFSHTPRQPLRPRNWNVTAEEEEEEGIRRGTRSLPETPARMSIASRRSWDSDPRISVQEESYYDGNKENLSVSALKELKCRFEEYSSSPASATKKMKVENGCSSSPCQYARDIVKQMKERVGRRMERSISTRNNLERPPTPTPAMKESQTQTPPATCSPRTVQVPGKKKGSSPKTKSVTKLTPLTEITECKKARCDRFNERLRSPSPTVAVSSSRKPRRSNRMNPRMPIIDVRREDIPLLLPPPPPQPPLSEPEELQYVKRVLERAAISRPRPNYPLDPIIFHELELSSPITNNSTSLLRHRCNRKLLFDIIMEIIVSEPLVNQVNAKFVLDRIWSKIRNYPQSKCETMEDIDALVGSDLRDINIRQLLNHHAVEEEGDIIAGEVENMVIDFLMVEVEHMSHLQTQ